MAKKQPNAANARMSTRRPSKVRPVPLGAMRIPPALYTQRQFRKAHGDELAAVLDLNKLGFLIINYRDGIYWVLDGQHRLYALKQNGFADTDVLDCEVYEDLTDPEMADIFLGRDERRPISAFDKFHVACTAGHRAECDIRRVVEAQGLKISQAKSENCVSSVGALRQLYDRSGDLVVARTVRTLKQAFEGNADAFETQLILGVGFVYNRYDGKTNERELATRLAAVPRGPKGLLQRAESLRERTGNQKAQCVAATIVDLYNRGAGPRAKDRLPSWWVVDGLLPAA